MPSGVVNSLYSQMSLREVSYSRFHFQVTRWLVGVGENTRAVLPILSGRILCTVDGRISMLVWRSEGIYGLFMISDGTRETLAGASPADPIS